MMEKAVNSVDIFKRRERSCTANNNFHAQSTSFYLFFILRAEWGGFVLGGFAPLRTAGWTLSSDDLL